MKIIPIFTISSAKYLKYLLVMIWSAMLYANPSNQYIFYVCHDGITQEKQLWFQQKFQCTENCKICFLNIWSQNKQFSQRNLALAGKMPCFSLFAAELLPQYEQLLVLDADMIIKRDIANLYHTDLGENLLGAVYDLDFIGQWTKGNKEYRRYYTEEVPLQEPARYIQAGVLLLNCRELRKQFPPGFFFEVAAGGKFRYDDQDIWNLYCVGQIKYLDYRWNVIHNNNHYRIRYIIDFAPEKMVAEYMKSREDPYIIHYAGDQKPWNDISCDFAQEFWRVAQQTPIGRELEDQLRQKPDKRVITYSAIRFLYHEVLRIQAKLRIFLKRI